MTYGSSAAKAMAHFNIDPKTWPALAANRATWREAIDGARLTLGRPTRQAAVETIRPTGASTRRSQSAGGR